MSQGIRVLAVVGVVGTVVAAAQADELPGLTLSLQPEKTAATTPATQPATPPAAAIEPAAEKGRAELTARAWFFGVTGDIGVRGTEINVDASFADMLDESGTLFGLSGRFEAGKGKWAGFLDGTFAKLGAEDQSGPSGTANVGVDFTLGILEFGAMYRLCEWVSDGHHAGIQRSTTLDIYAGGRYNYLEMRLSPEEGDSQSKAENWVDPIIGGRVIVPLGQRWEFQAAADVGGFRVASDMTWSLSGQVGYDFRMFGNPATAYAGYKFLGVDYGATDFEWDVVLHGPMLGLTLAF